MPLIAVWFGLEVGMDYQDRSDLVPMGHLDPLSERQVKFQLGKDRESYKRFLDVKVPSV